MVNQTDIIEAALFIEGKKAATLRLPLHEYAVHSSTGFGGDEVWTTIHSEDIRFDGGGKELLWESCLQKNVVQISLQPDDGVVHRIDMKVGRLSLYQRLAGDDGRQSIELIGGAPVVDRLPAVEERDSLADAFKAGLLRGIESGLT